MNKPSVRTRIPARSQQEGLTLVELMISLLLGVILSTGIVGVYLESKRNYAVEEEMARMQENGRFSINLLKRELNMAGLFGGSLEADEITAQAVSTDCAGSNWALDASEAIEFTNNHNSSASPTTINGTTLTCIDGNDIQPQTGVITIKRTSGEPAVKMGRGVWETNYTSSSDQKWFLQITNFGDGKNWSKLPTTTLDSLDPNDPDVIEAYWLAYTKVFYVRKFSESASDGIPTLCVETLEGDDMVQRCLVEGIEELQIEFGIDSDSDGVVERYTSAPSSAQMSNAVIARVYLLVRSIDEMHDYTNTKTYQLGQRTIAAKNDGYLRRVFTTTVQVRNAILPIG